MNIAINAPLLVVQARDNSGMKLGEMAKELHVAPARLSEWMSEKGTPNTDQIAWLADKAGMPILETIAALRPQFADIWRKAGETRLAL